MTAHYGDILDRIGPTLGEKHAIVHEHGVVTWTEFDARSNAAARALLHAGARPGDRVGFYLYNGPEYLIFLAACFKARLVHANVNYRYVTRELQHLLDDADAAVVLFDHRLAEHVSGLSPRRDGERILVQVGGSSTSIDGATLADDLVDSADASPLDGSQRSNRDQLFLYTGGTTGYPRGVVWELGTMAEITFAEEITERPITNEAIFELLDRPDRPRLYETGLVASPLMHGTGMWMAISMMANGDTAVVCDNADGFDPVKHLELIERSGADAMVVVGDPFARPLAKAVADQPDKARSLRVIGSSGAIWSDPVKQELLQHLPHLTLLDFLASSEATSVGASVSTAGASAETASFALSDRCIVFDSADRPVQPGDGQHGFLAVHGSHPLGYHNDPDKTASTFREIEGVRYCFTGDMCTVAADGSIHLLGRGSNCINTAGEKVFPEEVEEAIKTHPAVRDCLVLGLDDDKWGQAVSAIVESDDVDLDALKAYLKDGQLAGYKVPKRFITVTPLPRLANGKADYRTARRLLTDAG